MVNKNIYKEKSEELEIAWHNTGMWMKWFDKFWFIPTTEYYSGITNICRHIF